MFGNIRCGHKNPLKRPGNPFEDRRLRKAIEEANNNGDCIINVGNGYYRPVPGDPVDEAEFNRYLAMDLKRVRKTLKRRLSMKMTFERWREVAILTDDTGTAS